MWQKIKNLYHLIQAIVANFVYGFPSKKIKIIGITGTDGKTTTTHLVYHILNKNHLPCSMISTVSAKIGKKIYQTGFHVTTPSSFFIQKCLYEAVKQKHQFFVLETTSHALDQYRVFGIKYFIGLITNITHEHLDYHQTFKNYVKVKTKLINQSQFGVVNKQSEEYQTIKSFIKNKSLKLVDYSQNIKIIKNKLSHLTEYNLENYAAAFTISKILGLTPKEIIEAMKSFRLPEGRLAVVFDQKFKIIIDFAHTPNAFKKLLPEVKKNFLSKNGRLIHVFGAAGLRDQSKRPLMGEISSSYSDIIIITEEDYRTEDFNQIVQNIAEGVKKNGFELIKENGVAKINNKFYLIIKNRYQAIKQAVILAKENDVVLLTGKGHEKSLARGKKEFPWDEKKAVLSVLKDLKLYDSI